MPNNHSSPTLKLLISAKKTCNVNISGNGYNANVRVTGGSTVTHTITKNSAAYTTALAKVSKTALRVVSSDTISLYASNHMTYSSDANNVLPTSALGSKYMAASYYGKSNVSGQRSTLLIVATENNTRVDITPRNYKDSVVIRSVNRVANVSKTYQLHHPRYGMILVDSVVSGMGTNNLRLTYHLPTYGSTVTTPVMNAGESYYYGTGDDLTGTIVEAQACKKIAVFSGHQRTSVGMPLSTSYSSDHLVEQMLPFNSLGKNFVLVPTMDRIKDRVRIIAAENNTKVNIENNSYTLNQGTFYEADLTDASFVQSSKPVMTIIYPISMKAPDGNKNNSNLGDNSMIWVNPVEQNLPDIIFAALPTSLVVNHYVNIIVNTASASQTTLNGQNIGARFTPVPNNKDYSYARIGGISAESAQHLENPEGLAAYVYGYGNAEAYGYTAGSSVKNLLVDFFVNDVASNDLSNITFLEKDTLKLSTSVDGNSDWEITWTISDTEVKDGIVVFDSAGCRELTLTVHNPYDACGVQTSSITKTICIRPSDIKITATPYVCQGETLNNSYFENAKDIKWYTSDTATVGETTPPTISDTATTTQFFWVTQTVNGVESHKVKLQVNLYTPVAEMSDTSICLGESILLPSNFFGSPVSWIEVEGLQTPDSVGSYIFSGMVHDPYCPALRTLRVHVKPIPSLRVLMPDTTYSQIGDTVYLRAKTTGDASIDWSEGDTVIYPMTPGITSYTATATENLCSSSKTIYIVTGKREQTIAPIANIERVYGTSDFELSAQVSSNLPITFSVAEKNDVISFTQNNIVHILNVGEVTVIANQAGDKNYLPVSTSFRINIIKAKQEIDADDYIIKTYGDANFTIKAKSTSNLPLNYSIEPTDVVAINDSIVQVLNVGTAQVNLYQDGGRNYISASAKLTIEVNKKQQEIERIGDILLYADVRNFPLSLSSNSGLSVSLKLPANNGVIELKDSIAYVNGVGEILVEATQEGNRNYMPDAHSFYIDIVDIAPHIIVQPTFEYKEDSTSMQSCISIVATGTNREYQWYLNGVA
ncbi:MAG: IgGFc-binding protein, partial [Bacteroidales bacterium]